MKIFLFSTLLLAAPVRAQEEAAPACVTQGSGYYLAKVEDPARNFTLLTEPRAFREVCGAGIIVTNGTFFAPRAALGDVVVDGKAVYSPQGKARRFKRGERFIDLGRRWGIGALRATGTLALSDGDEALGLMSTFLGGGGLLLQDGRDATALNEAAPQRWGPSFPSEGILSDKRGRVALGLKNEDGKQVLLLVKTENAAGADVSALAGLMKSLGATDAVFYDGGGAQGYAMGGRCLILPTNPGEDVNPTHIVIKACR